MADPKTILEAFENRVNESSTRPALRRRVDSVWTPLSWKEWWESSERVAAALVDRGVQAGDRVLLLCETRVEWVIADVAIMMLGGITVPVYPSLGPMLVKHIAVDSGAVAALVSDPLQLDKLVEHRAELRELEHVVWIEPEVVRPVADFRGRFSVRVEQVLADDDPWNESLENLAAHGRRVLAEDARVVSRRRRKVGPDDLATIVYTSGTTGVPRGVQVSHHNLTTQVLALRDLDLFSADDVQVLFLPLAHIFARVLYLTAIGYGMETAIPDDMRSLLADMLEVQPTFFAGVPQLFEQVRAKVERDAGRTAVRERLFRVAERIGQSTDVARRSLEAGSVVERVGRAVLDRVQPDRARQVFGGKVRFAISGGAPLNPDTAAFFSSFGLEILEGYGLTETTAVATVNVPHDRRVGSVGRPLRRVDITIDEDGEVLVRGPSVTPGYWRDEAATRASKDADGWFRTGDLGQFDRDGFLHITGRKKELIVTAGGKNVAPAPVEAALESLGIVARAVVFGDRRPYIVALLELDLAAATTLAREQGITKDELQRSEAFSEGLATAVAEVNESLAGAAVVRRWAIIDPLESAEGALTATGKLRRQKIAEIHEQTLAALYGD